MEKIKNLVKANKLWIVLAAIVTVAIIVVIVIITNKKGEPSVSTSDVESSVSSTDTTDYLSGIGTAPDAGNDNDSENSSNIIDFPNGEDKTEDTTTNVSTSESKPSEESTSVSKPSEESTSVSKPSESKPSESKPSEESTSVSKPSESKPSESKPSESKPSESVTEPTTQKPSESKPSKTGPSFTGGTITLENIGISIPTLNEFNKAGLEQTDNMYWYGGSDVSTSTEAMNILFDNARAIMKATGIGVQGSAGNGFTVSEYWMEWATAAYGVNNDIMLQRDIDNDQYVLIINVPLDKFESVTHGGKDIAPMYRDILKFMISSFSSTPETVYNYLYNGIYYDASTLNCSIYQKVGDCQILLDKNFYFADDGIHLKFYIKPAK